MIYEVMIFLELKYEIKSKYYKANIYTYPKQSRFKNFQFNHFSLKKETGENRKICFRQFIKSM